MEDEGRVGETGLPRGPIEEAKSKGMVAKKKM